MHLLTQSYPCVRAQIMFNIEKAHMILDEIVVNGEIIETNRTRILAPVRLPHTRARTHALPSTLCAHCIVVFIAHVAAFVL